MVAREPHVHGDRGYDEPLEFTPDLPVLDGTRAAIWPYDEPPPQMGDSEWRLPGTDPDVAGMRYTIVWKGVPDEFRRGPEVGRPVAPEQPHPAWRLGAQ